MAADQSPGRPRGPGPRQDKAEKGLSPNATLGIGLVVCAGLVVAAVLGSRFFKAAPPPPMPPPAPTQESVTNGELRYSVGYYRATIEEDSKKWTLPPPVLEQLEQPFPFYNELAAPKTLKPDHDQLDTPHLHLSTKVSKEWSGSGSAQSMRVEHMMLSITNKSTHPVAYRVDTFAGDSKRCKSKGVMLQNAIALQPGQTIERSECLWFKDSKLEVRAIEVMELSPLGFLYASRLSPSQVLLDERSTAGHEPPNKMKTCTFVPWREIRGASEAANGVRWADVIDFYARHNCDEYSFYTSYRRWTQPGQLPAHAQAELPPTPTPPLEQGTKSR